MVPLLIDCVLTNGVWIESGRCEHPPAVRQVDRRRSVRRLHVITQPKHRRRVVDERDGRKLRALPLRHAELHAPSEQQARDEPVFARDLRDADAGLVALQGYGALLFVGWETPHSCRGGAGSSLGAAVKPVSGGGPVSTSASDRTG